MLKNKNKENYHETSTCKHSCGNAVTFGASALSLEAVETSAEAEIYSESASMKSESGFHGRIPYLSRYDRNELYRYVFGSGRVAD